MKIKLTRLELFLKSVQPSARTAHFEHFGFAFSYLRCWVKAISETLWHTKFKRIAVNKSGLNLRGVSPESQKMVPSISFFFFFLSDYLTLILEVVRWHGAIFQLLNKKTVYQKYKNPIHNCQNTKASSTCFLLSSAARHFTPNDDVFWMKWRFNLNYLVSTRVSFLVRQQDYTKTTERISRKLGRRMSFSSERSLFIFGAESDKGTDPGNACSLSLTSQDFPDVSTHFSARE